MKGLIMSKINVAVVGYGNIGQYVIDALESTKDFSIAGIVRRQGRPIPGSPYRVVSDIRQLADVDVAILAVPSRSVEEYARDILSLGINTVDSFDIHSEIAPLKNRLAELGKQHNASAIISAGWDPGTDSILRTIFLAAAPKGVTYTNFGPGMSMGHSTVVKNFVGVKDALSVTIPTGTGVHRRMVYIEVEEGHQFNDIKERILKDEYFINDETIITEVDSVDDLKDAGHGVNIVRKGTSGKTPNQLFEFDMRVNNPALTAQIMVSSARAAYRQSPGAYTLIEIPLIDLLPGERDHLISELV